MSALPALAIEPSATPECVFAWMREAFALHHAGDIAAAAARYEDVLSVDPDQADALHLLGVCRRQTGQPADAVALISRALALMPSLADGWYNLGNALADVGRPADAADAFARASALCPHNSEALMRFAAMLTRLDRRDDAIAAYHRVLALDAAHVACRNDLGNLLTGCGRDEEAVGLFRSLLADLPDLPEAHYNLALVLLRLGDYASGLAEYEWRWRCAGFRAPRRHAAVPAWNGKPLAGRRLLVHAEQGLGDCIQFARFVPLAASLGGSVTFEVPKPLVVLMRQISGVDRLIAQGEGVGEVDCAVPLVSLPHRLGLSLGAVGMAAPYLTAASEQIALWRRRLGSDGVRTIGVCWRGNPASPADPGRSLADPGLLAPLAVVPGVRLVSLVMPTAHAIEKAPGPTGWQMAGLPFALAHPGPDLDAGGDAFVDSAAIMASLDLVLTTDTALAHLAGALGRPVWVMLQAAADWRWLKRRADSPWYPSMRLFRQHTPGDWAGVITRVGAALAGHAAASAGSGSLTD